MELEELKNMWQSVKPHISSKISDDDANKIAVKNNDIKSRLLKRARWDGVFSIICLMLMALSPFWSPMKLPYWWLTVFALLYSSPLSMESRYTVPLSLSIFGIIRIRIFLRLSYQLKNCIAILSLQLRQS